MNMKAWRFYSLALALILPFAIMPGPLRAQQNLVATLIGHSGDVRTVAFSPDGKMLASGGGDDSIRLWDVESHRERTILKGHTETVSSVAFSPDGKLLASGSYDRTILLWDIATGKKLATLEEGTDKLYATLPYSVAFSPNGRILASSGSGDHGANLWDVAKRALLPNKADQPTWAYQLAFSPNGKFLAKCDTERTTARLDLTTGKEVIIDSTPVTGTVSCVAISSDNSVLAVGGRKHSATLWDLTTGAKLSTLQSDQIVRPPPRFGGCGIPIDGLVYSIAFSPDGEIFAMASYDCAIKLWNLKTGKKLESLKGHEDMVWSVAFSPDGKLLASGCFDGSVKIWNISGGH